MILENFFEALRPRNLVTPTWTRPELVNGYALPTVSGQKVTPDSARQISTFYRCFNTICNDVAKIPLQLFVSRRPGEVERIRPNGFQRNMAYVVEVQPNHQQTPIIFKRTTMKWLLLWGNAYIWMKPGREREMFVLPSSYVTPYNETDGSIWYELQFPGEKPIPIPAVEILHLLINSDNGLTGRGVLTFARETMGRRQASSNTQSNFYAQGLRPSAIMQMEGEINAEARKKVRDSYSESMAGTENAGGLAVIDKKVSRFDIVQMQPKDAQFLESMEFTDLEIANFFEFPAHKLNLGKQAYESNEQQALDYLATTLDPYLVQWEQAAQIKWLTTDEQAYTYWRFERNALLRTDAKTRAEVLEKKIFSGQMLLGEARSIEDMPARPGDQYRLIPANYAVITPEGEIRAISQAPGAGANQNVQELEIVGSNGRSHDAD